MNERTFEILIREIGGALVRAADQIKENAPIAPGPSAEVVPLRQPAPSPSPAPAAPAASAPTVPAQWGAPAQTPVSPAPAPAQAPAQWGAPAATPAAPAVSLNDVVAAFRQLQQAKGPDPINGSGGILEQFGIARVSEAKVEQYPALVAAAQARMQ